MGDIFRLTIVLVVISIVAAILLAFTYDRTKDAISQQQARVQAQALQEVLPEGVTIAEVKGKGPRPALYWAGVRNGDTVAFAFQVRNRGYSSDIVAMVGVRPQGEIIGVNILEQAETPGLGTRVQETVSRRYVWNGLFGKPDVMEPWFTEQFEGVNVLKPIAVDRPSGEWHGLDENARRRLEERNAVTAITGATISTRAVSTALETKAAAYLRTIKGVD